MKNNRAALIHDISGFGKCSLTVALPILSAAGVETCPIPTAVLSTHTGGFEGYTYRDLTDDILPTARHWHALKIPFDCVYTGYLGSESQVDLVCQTIDLLSKKDTFVVVDPVMADHGKLYSAFDENFPEKMKTLIKKADIITPNITESCLLTNRPYKTGPYTGDFIERLIKSLANICTGDIVITGVHFNTGQLGCACYNAKSGEVSYHLEDTISGIFHGTGDIFCSCLSAALLRELPLKKACDIAVKITTNAIKATKKAGTDPRFGVKFEQQLETLMRLLAQGN